MQVQNNYNLYHNQSNHKSHTHHITECMHEEEVKKREGDIGSKNSTSSYQKGDVAKAAVEYVASFSVEEMSVSKKKSGVSTLKGYWDMLGEEQESENAFDLKNSLFNGIHGVAISIQGFFTNKVVNRFVTVKNRIKAMPSSLIKQFGKGKDAFSALTGGNTTFGQKNPNARDKERSEPINTLKPTNEHLMDSYNKTGAYCQLQDNLTYQKPQVAHSERKKEIEQ